MVPARRGGLRQDRRGELVAERRRVRRVRLRWRGPARAEAERHHVRAGDGRSDSGTIAIQGLRDEGRLQAGEHALINGAGGGVGTFAVQIAKAFGAEVTAVDEGEKLAMLRSMVADHVIDHTREDFTRGDARYDLILDIPANHHFSEIRRALTPDGTCVLIGHDAYGRLGRRWIGTIGRFLALLVRSPFSKHLPGLRGANDPAIACESCESSSRLAR